MSFPLLFDKILENARLHPKKCVLINARDGHSVTYAELIDIVDCIYAWLAAKGVKPSDKIILAAARDFRFIYFYLALHKMAAVAVPIDPGISVDRYKFIHEKVQPSLSLWPNAVMPKSTDLPDIAFLDKSMPSINLAKPDMLADIMFTSGTTGEPKGVLLTHSNLACAINNIIQFIGNTADDIEICPMPLSHSFGIARLRCVLYAGGTYILEDGIARPKHLFESMTRYKVTGLSMVGPAWNMLRKLSGNRIMQFRDQLRYMELGSAPLTAQVKKELAELLPNTRVCMHYGLTEASRATFLEFHDDEQHLDSVGKAAPLSEIAIYSESGKVCAAGVRGEICVHGGMVTSGYLDQEKNRDLFFADGFFRTGDLGKLDANGYLTLDGRLKEIINVGGEKVTPIEVESVINTFPGIADSACVGKFDEILGETVAAFLVLKNAEEPVDIPALRAYLSQKLEAFKVPKHYEVIKALPVTVTGKIQRAALKQNLAKDVSSTKPAISQKAFDMALHYAERAFKTEPYTKKYRDFYYELLRKKGTS